jgi:signal peptidase complex subunit 3
MASVRHPNSADLAPAFDWNVKQLFVFVVAEYRSKTNPLNQVPDYPT